MEVMEQMATQTVCASMKTLFSYLGMTVGCNICSKEAWKGVMLKLLSKISSLKTTTHLVRHTLLV